MTGSLYRCADCGRYMTELGECILALLLLARRCNVSIKNGDIYTQRRWRITRALDIERR